MAIPLVSIIIPALNEEEYIGLCLKSLTTLDWPLASLEVIVVDNGSSDGTVKISESFGCTVEVLPHTSIAALRNRGARVAKGQVFAFLDADCVVERSWLRNAMRVLENPVVGIVGCSVFRLPANCSWVERTWKSQKKKTQGFVDWVGSGNMIVRRRAFEKLNGFREEMISSEDCDLCLRLRKSGLKVYSSEDVGVVHCRIRRSLKEFFKKEVWHGKSVFKAALTSQQRLRDSNAVLLALFYVGSMIGAAGTLVLGLLSGNYLPLVVVISVMVLLPFVLAVKKGSIKKSVLGLTLLYLLYGLARALCIVDFRNWTSRVRKLDTLSGYESGQ